MPLGKALKVGSAETEFDTDKKIKESPIIPRLCKKSNLPLNLPMQNEPSF
jgi:hypothetical protein